LYTFGSFWSCYCSDGHQVLFLYAAALHVLYWALAVIVCILKAVHTMCEETDVSAVIEVIESNDDVYTRQTRTNPRVYTVSQKTSHI